MPPLPDQDDPPVAVDGHDGDRSGVLDDLATGEVAVHRLDGVDVDGEQAPLEHRPSLHRVLPQLLIDHLRSLTEPPPTGFAGDGGTGGHEPPANPRFRGRLW